ncbi:RNA polymerase sigma-70 factor, ECF subfamily [Nitrosospira sp. Nl5]|uniref:RNA polymerase factor sigma-70 n=1 Tax=Nitrosospira sp. Nl5 TaxID=200120 RepID=UPI0008860117|nr:RNA polymerase factor sigma-70 [Nitrosospira sp. Nl5]SCY65073.1 RNA polymerase sigma-70 factor, ECF subfamily [Nitrosospira sp. Nl5]
MLVDQQTVDLSSVFVAHQAQLRRAALNIVRNPERAEDVVQDAYLKVTETAGILNIKQPLAYLLQMVRNLAIDRHRRAAFEGGLFEREEEGFHVPALIGTPESTAISRQHLALIAGALSELPERTRRVFELYRLDGHTHCAIASKLEISTSLVNILIHDAMDHCRAAIQSM